MPGDVIVVAVVERMLIKIADVIIVITYIYCGMAHDSVEAQQCLTTTGVA